MKLIQLWRAFTLIALFFGTYIAAASGTTWQILLWFVWALVAYKLADATDEDTTWAPIYGITWGILAIFYYSVIYFKNEH